MNECNARLMNNQMKPFFFFFFLEVCLFGFFHCFAPISLGKYFILKVRLGIHLANGIIFDRKNLVRSCQTNVVVATPLKTRLWSFVVQFVDSFFFFLAKSWFLFELRSQEKKMIDATFKKLHAALDDPNTSQPALKLALERNFNKFSAPLSIPAASEASRQLIRSKKITWREKLYSLGDSSVNNILDTSDFLRLDEMEAFALFRNFLVYQRKDVKLGLNAFEFRPIDRLELLDYFYEERLSILRCLCSIFRIADDAEEPLSEQCRDTANRLLTAGLESTLIKALFKYGDPPENIAKKQIWRERWARFQIEIQEELLKILFLIYYNHDVKPDQLASLMGKCLAEAFGGRPKILPLLDDLGRKTVTRIQYLSVLLLLECMNLERYINKSGPWLPSNVVEAINEMLLKEAESRCELPQHGPIFMAWSALLHQYYEEEELDEKEHTARLRSHAMHHHHQQQPLHEVALTKRTLGGRSLQLGAIDLLCRMLAGFENEPNSSMIGYQNVVHGFITLLVNAYPVFINSPELINLYRLVFNENLLTCAQFWQHHFEVPSQRLLFDKARMQFPFRFLPYIQLITALVRDLESAQRVQDLLEKSDIFAAPEGLSLSGALLASSQDSDAGHVQLDRPHAVQITCWYGLQEVSLPLPEGTTGIKSGKEERGRQSKSAQNPELATYVSWHVNYSAFDIFLPLIDAFLARITRFDLQMQHVEQMTAIFSLFAKLLPYQSAATLDGPADFLIANSSLLIPLLLDVLQQVTTLVGSPRFAHVVKPKLMANLPEASVAPKLCELLQSCLACLELYARTDPRSVWLALQRCCLLESFGQRRPGSMASSSTLTHTPSVFFSLESSMGRYPVTSSFLSLMTTLLHFLKSWPVSGSDQSAAASSSMVFEPSFLATPSRSHTSTSKLYHNLPDQSTTVIDDDDDDVINSNHIGGSDDMSAVYDDESTSGSSLLSTDAFEPALYYLRTDVLSCFARGRFAKISDRWQMGAAFLKIIEAMLSDPTLSYQTISNEQHPDSSQGSWLRSVAFESTFLHTLLSVVATGHGFLDKSRLRYGKQAQMLEELLLLGLLVLERLLLLDEKGRVRQTLLSRTIGKDNVHLVFVIASYIYYVHNTGIPLVATRILTHLCKPQQPNTRPVSLLGYIGGDEELRSVFLYRLWKSHDSTTLRVAILGFLSTCIEHQPGLIDMFLNLPRTAKERDERLKKKYVSGSVAESSRDERGASEEPPDSCLDVVFSIIATAGEGPSSPELFAAAVSMLHTLWKLASQHQSTIRYLRQIPNFWKSLVTPLIEKLNPRIFQPAADATIAQITGQSAHSLPIDADELRIPDEQAFPECFRIVARAWTLKILTLEILDQQSCGPSEPVKEQFGKIQDSQLRWMRSFCRVHFNTQVTKDLETLAKRLGVPLRRALSQGPQRSYGRSYVYDIGVIVQKLAHAKDRSDVQRLVKLVEQTNCMFSLAEAELLLLHSWCRFVQITAHFGIIRYMDPIEYNEESDTAFLLISGLTGFLEEETRHSVMAIKKLNEIAELLESLLHLRLKKPLSNSKTDARLRLSLSYLISNLIKTVRRVNEHLACFPPSLGRRRDADPSFQMLLCIQRYLLTSLFFLLGPGHALNFSKDCHTLLPELGLALAHPPLLDIGLATLQRVVSSHLTGPASEVSPEAFTATLRDDKMCPTVLDFLAVCLDNEQNPATALLASHLLLSLSQNEHTAEALLVSGYMLLLTSRSFGSFAAKLVPYDASHCRDTWHQIWCLIISSICSLIRQMGFSHSFLDQALRFVVIHFDRLVQPLYLSSTITLAQLDEARCITELFAQLVVYKTSWTAVLGQMAALHQQQMLTFMAACINRLLNRETLHQSCEPFTKEEREDALTVIQSTTSQVDSVLLTQTPVRRGGKRKTSTASRQPIEEHVLFRQVEEGLLACLLNTLSFVRRNSPDPCLFMPDRKVASLDPEILVPLFSSVIDSSTADEGVLPLGIITELLNWCSMRLSQLDSQEDREQNQFAALQKRTRTLIFQLIGEALYIILGHIGLFIWRSNGDSNTQRLQSKFLQLESVMQALSRRSECAYIATGQAFLAQLGISKSGSLSNTTVIL